MHYQRWKRHGDPTVVLPRSERGANHVTPDAILTCTKCGEQKAAALFPLVPANRSGRSGSCKRCAADYAITRWRGSPEVQAKERARANAYRAANPHIRQAQTARYYARHGDEIKARVKDYAARNRESVLARQAAYRAKPGVLERAARASAEWRALNPDRAKDLNRVVQFKRQARLRNARTVPFTADQLAARIRFFGYQCWMCKGPYEHLDHVKPIAAGGLHVLSNIRPACARCNLSKNRTWHGAAWTLTLIK
jgi:5-methylcytosine-specific restriction endonuclease McrA